MKRQFKVWFFPGKINIQPSLCLVSLKTGKSFSLCSLSKYSAKYFCPMNHKPVNPVSSAAINISPRGDEYLFVYCIACIFP